METHTQPAPRSEVIRTISQQDLMNLPIRRYGGEVCLVRAPADLDRALRDIRHEHVVGFDTETRPVFKKGHSHLPCLAQVATARAVYLFQLKRLDASRPLAELLESARVIKTGVAM